MSVDEKSTVLLSGSDSIPLPIIPLAQNADSSLPAVCLCVAEPVFVSVDEKLAVLLSKTDSIPLLTTALAALVRVAEPVFVSVDEKLTVLLSKTGGLESLEIQGTMSVVIGNDADAYVQVQVCYDAKALASCHDCAKLSHCLPVL